MNAYAAYRQSQRQAAAERQRLIDRAKRDGDWQRAELLAADWLDSQRIAAETEAALMPRAAGVSERARQSAAAVAPLPLGQRIGRAVTRVQRAAENVIR